MSISRLIYASTKDADLLYNISVPIPDPSIFLDCGDVQYLVLDHREYDAYCERSVRDSVKPVRLEEYWARYFGEAQGDIVSFITQFVAEKASSDTIHVGVSFPLWLADGLRANGMRIDPQGMLYPERLVKSGTQRDYIRRAIEKSHAAFRHIEQVLSNAVVRDGVLWSGDEPLTSERLKQDVEVLLLRDNEVNPEGIIISCGKHAAMPHHTGSGVLCAGQTIICDIFPLDRETGYFGDMTRTYLCGAPTPCQQSMYQAVKQVQDLAFSMIRPGVVVSDIYDACVALFVKLGFHAGDKGFVHGVGHGLGMEVHEIPYIRKGKQDVLREGMVVTVEPGLYYPEHGGVRIEDVAYVTRDGYENLTNYPRIFVIDAKA